LDCLRARESHEDRIDFALEVAAKAHYDQKRKGTDTPYITHPVAVAMILLRAGCPDDLIIAGLLHDTVEDANIPPDYIRDNFGEKVASIVAGCSEPGKSLSWEERKNHTLEYLKTASMDVRIVTCADKLSNIRSIASDYRMEGEAIWDRFKRGREKQAWYYKGIVESLCHGIEPEDQPAIFKMLKDAVTDLFA
jgi:(p)ppGpp synthase/HD superfamily hydrolase